PKYVFTDGLQIEARNINGYLADAPSVFVYRRTKALSSFLPKMVLGSMPKDWGHLVIDPLARAAIVAESPAAGAYVKR
ncbi:type IIL restriction-modification enzyme MmeI, partial [Salmonella enterica]|uniref:type IIL restriction-modification enzyme MmeI n=1 Tax=Salmonella enterica TaxID=28901 RepID=UPI0019D60F0A